MGRLNSTRYGTGILGGAMLLIPAFSPLAAESRGGVIVSVGGEVTSNPYLDQSSSSATLAATGEIRPWYRSENETTSFNLEAFAHGRAYAKDYQFEDSYGASAGVTTRASETVNLYARAGIYSSNNRARRPYGNDFVALEPIPAVPLPPDPLLINDLTLLGYRGRSTTVSGDVGGDVRVSERTTLTANAGYQHLSASNIGGANYSSFSGGLGVSHKLTEQTSVGFNGGWSRTNYKDPRYGDATTYTAMANVGHRFNETTTLRVGGGVAYTKTDRTALYPGGNRTSFTGNLSLCDANPDRSICLNAARAPQSSSFGGVRNADSIDLNWTQRLSEKDRVSFGGGYAHTGKDPYNPVNDPAIDYYRAHAMYERDFNDRLSGFVSASFEKADRHVFSTDPSYTIGAGLKFRLGARR